MSQNTNNIEKYSAAFQECDRDGDGFIDVNELVKLCKTSIPNAKYDHIMTECRALGNNKSNSINQDDFLKIASRLFNPPTATTTQSKEFPSSPSHKNSRSRQGSLGGTTMDLASSPREKKQITRLSGATGSSQHSIDDEELTQFVHHINQVMQCSSKDEQIPTIDPLTHELFEKCQDGQILSKLINDSVPETIDERVLNKGLQLNPFQMTENNNLVINSAKAIGCSVVNIGSQDLIEGREHLVLGLIWQIIKRGLLAKVSLQIHPELYRLLKEGETLEDLLRLPADALLLRWFNYHLSNAADGGWKRRVENFSSDIKDSKNYIVLLSQLCPADCDQQGLNITNDEERAALVVKSADRIGCQKYVSVKAIVEGNPKLNLAFIANLFNHHPGLAPLTEEEKAEFDDSLFNSVGDRQARAFSLWMNSLGVEPFVNSLYDDLRDGRILLQTFDKVKPSIVDWKRVSMRGSLIRFKCIENTNYVVELGKKCNFSLVGIQGADITDGSKTLTLALVWQLMREHVIETLKSLSNSTKSITDSDIIEWANQMTSSSSSIPHPMNSFKDKNLKDSKFLLNLLNAMKSGIVDFSLITDGNTERDLKMNAMYAISIARKMGATIFLLPEDIIEVNAKMIMTFVGTLMAIAKQQNL